MLSPAEGQILATSFAVAARALIWSLPFAIAIAFALSRPRFPGKLALDGLTHLPVILPPVLIGFLLLLLFGRRGLLGGWLAAAGIIFRRQTGGGDPMTVFPAGTQHPSPSRHRLCCSTPPSVLGAGSAGRFLTILLPLAGPGILAGALTGSPLRWGPARSSLAPTMPAKARPCRWRSIRCCRSRAAKPCATVGGDVLHPCHAGPDCP